MSATKDLLMEVEEAKEYAKHRLSRFKPNIDPCFSDHVTVIVGNAEFDVVPIVRKDFYKSRRLKGWQVQRVVNEEPLVALKLSRSYERAFLFVERELEKAK